MAPPKSSIVKDADLNLLLTATLTKANASSSLEDLGKAAQIAKDLSEAQKAKIESDSSGAQIKLEGWKSTATFLVPVVSLLTVLFTIYMQYLQLEETHRQNEATQWREFLTSAKASSTNIQSDPTFSPRLRSFFSSPMFGDQAISISKHMMGGIANASGFKELFGVTFGEVSLKNIDDVVEVGRSLYANFTAVHSICSSFAEALDDEMRKKIPVDDNYNAGICSPTIPEKTIRQAGLNSDETQKLGELRRNTANIQAQNYFLGQQIAGFLRTKFRVNSPQSAIPISLKGLYLIDVDLSDVDFSNFDLTETVFDSVILDRAKLTPKAFGAAMDIRYSAWWNVSEIDQKALNSLMEDYYPYYISTESFPGGDVDESTYRAQISKLCKSTTPACSNSLLKFGKKAALSK